MSCKWFLILLAIVISMFALAACGGSGGGDDDDNQGDDDAGDDDSGDDDADDDVDDDLSGNLTVDNVSAGDCLDGAGEKDEPWDPLSDPTNVVEVTWEDGVLKIDDLFAYVNCGVELEVEANAEANVVTVEENDVGSPYDCWCPFNFHYEISDITADAIQLVVKRNGEGAFTLVELTLPLGSANKKWFIPLVEVFFANGGTSASDPVILSYAACNLYHLDDQQIYVSQNGNNFFAYGYDWYDVDNPGDYVPTCQMPVSIELGAQPSGDYFFGAPTHNLDIDEWSMLTAVLEIP